MQASVWNNSLKDVIYYAISLDEAPRNILIERASMWLDIFYVWYHIVADDLTH